MRVAVRGLAAVALVGYLVDECCLDDKCRTSGKAA